MGRRGIGELHHNERRALALLRFPATGCGTDDALDTAFDNLRGAGAVAGLTLMTRPSRHVCEDEIVLLGWLARLQRRNGAEPTGVSSALGEALRQCARHLLDADIRLPFRAAVRDVRLSAEQPGDDDRRATDVARSIPHRPRHLTAMQVRARAVMENRRFVSTRDFVASGVSRQSVSNLCRDGLIERVNTGWYRAREPLLSQN